MPVAPPDRGGSGGLDSAVLAAAHGLFFLPFHRFPPLDCFFPPPLCRPVGGDELALAERRGAGPVKAKDIEPAW
jgi:hypothetical protein